MWQAETSDPEQTAGSEFSYHRSVQNARQGVQLIREAGIQMQMITEDGWVYLMSQVSRPKPKKRRRNQRMEDADSKSSTRTEQALGIDPDVWDRRMRCTQEMDEFLRNMAPVVLPSGSSR